MGTQEYVTPLRLRTQKLKHGSNMSMDESNVQLQGCFESQVSWTPNVNPPLGHKGERLLEVKGLGLRMGTRYFKREGERWTLALKNEGVHSSNC